MSANSEQHSLYHVCRTCMSQQQCEFPSLYETLCQQMTIAATLISCAPQVPMPMSTDQLPQQICTDCLQKLKAAYEFQQLCISSDKQLRVQLSEVEPQLKTEQEPTASTGCLEPLDGDKVNAHIKAPELINANNIKVEKPCNQDMAHVEPFIKNECDPLTEVETPIENIARKAAESIVYSITHIECDTLQAGEADDDDYFIERPRNNKHKCTICEKQFRAPGKLQAHLSVHSPSHPHQCDICQYRFLTEHQLRAHKISHTSNNSEQQTSVKGFKCSYCPRRFAVRQSWVAHQSSHRKVTNFKCDYCQKTYDTLAQLNGHFRKFAQHRIHKCQLCPKTFGNSTLLQEHLESHKCRPAAACEHCKKVYRGKAALDDHMRSHTGEKPFLCPECGKAFSTRKNLQQHLLTHQIEKPFECDECPRKFSARHGLTKHKATHSNSKPYVCDECGNSFTRVDSMNQHKLRHTGKRPYKCQECNLSFVLLSTLARHRLIHTGERPYPCQYCQRAFATSSDLHKHLRTHLGENTYLCKECTAAFKFHAELRAHEMQHYEAKKMSANAQKDSNNTDAAPQTLKTELPNKVETNAVQAE